MRRCDTEPGKPIHISRGGAEGAEHPSAAEVAL